jgi:hypothetical protein
VNAQALRRLVNGNRNGMPFDPATSIAPPSGVRGSWVNYGVMVPNLPEPHRTFGVMSVVGTPGVSIFANDHAITTTSRGTAYLVSATASMTSEQFRTYSIEKECEFAPDGRVLRFGEDLLVEGQYPTFRLRRHHSEVDVDLQLTATDKVSYFVDVVGGLYSHWSLLCRYHGTVGDIEASGLCTFEYARGIGVHSLPVLGRPNGPATFFTYQVINIDQASQLLMTEVLGPFGLPLTRSTSEGLTVVPNVDGQAFSVRWTGVAILRSTCTGVE